jgi:hypothetical protein
VADLVEDAVADVCASVAAAFHRSLDTDGHAGLLELLALDRASML